MKWLHSLLLLTASCSLAEGTTTSASAQTGAEGAAGNTHIVHSDVPYGNHARQVMDIHLGREAARLGERNHTIVFLHGGGFSFGDKTDNGRYVTPFLLRDMNVVNMSYRIRQGVAVATEDLTNALNHLARNNHRYGLDLSNVIVGGFSAGAMIATTVGLSQNDPGYPFPLDPGIRITAILNFSGPVDRLAAIEEIFRSSADETWQLVGRNLFPADPRFTREEMIEKFTPFTYLRDGVPPIFLSHGGLDDQVPPSTFARFVESLRSSSTHHRIVFYAEAGHSKRPQELDETFIEVFRFLDGISRRRAPVYDIHSNRQRREPPCGDAGFAAHRVDAGGGRCTDGHPPAADRPRAGWVS
jgi:acetyl esterase/lipase